ncbi:beta-N-acetylhexosaminidase [Cohnella sp. WQ 127256]|uniref:beta-N-acetylhexosaminidase n=1 Tax=Cohnella sp. WQ 127256 TaxID=2938790 RepID=UPI002117368F|nr:beta-N-acetylhexosaminidase [Cohnella sp. WQ 127256]
MKITVSRQMGFVCICLLLLLIVSCASGSSGSATPSHSQSNPTHSSTQAASTPPSTPTPTVPTPSSASPSDAVPKNEDEIGKMMSTMTLEQKIGQMILAGIEGTKIDKSMKKMISEQFVGGIIFYKNNFSNLDGSVRLVNDLKKANVDNPVPLFISIDQEGGKVSRLPKDFISMPDAAKVGRTGNPELAKEMGALLSKELNLMGFNLDFAPVLDINSNPNNPVIGSRSFGNNAKLVTKMGLAAMKGMQDGGTITVVKHFPGHGDTSVDSHLDLPIVNKTTKQLEKMEWVPFKAAIEDNADAVMVAHILFPSIDPDAPASFSKVIIGEQLRGTLGFNGVVITDDMTMGAIADHYGIADASVKSVEAGSDILLIAHGYDTEKKVFNKLLQAVKSGQITQSRIDESVRRILALKLKYQLSDEPIPVPTKKDLPNAEIQNWLDKLK